MAEPTGWGRESLRRRCRQGCLSWSRLRWAKLGLGLTPSQTYAAMRPKIIVLPKEEHSHPAYAVFVGHKYSFCYSVLYNETLSGAGGGAAGCRRGLSWLPWIAVLVRP
uniref:Uncharacterized protein n=1 Tax=Oryza nivara TaxID=4536 RepID=A0A0E0FYI8_ORYNI